MLGRNLRERPWRLLCGLDEPQWDFQRALFLFQIKFWLTGCDDIRHAFAKATTYFYLQAFQDGLKQYANASPSWKLKELLKYPSYRALYNYALVKNNPIDTLGLPTFEEEVAWRDEHRAFMRAEAHFALCRLTFINQKNEHRRCWAEKYFEKYRPKGLDGIVGLNKKDEYRGYTNKAAYLAAASLVLPELFNLGTTWPCIRDDGIPDTRVFQLFCMHVRAIASALNCPGNVELRLWTGLEPLMPELPEIPAELLDGWSKKVRRSAETTALGDKGRQRPQPKTRPP